MNRSLRWLLTLAVLPGAVACASATSATGDISNKKVAPTGGDGGSKVVDAPADAGAADQGWEQLITGNWTLPPGEEDYFCARQTIDHDLFVNGFDAIKPLGTHHTLLTMGDPNAPDGVTPCTAGDNRPLSVFGSGVGTDRLEFPKGIGLKIAAGTQLLLNLHLFNTAEEPLSGLSGTRVHRIDEKDVVDVAEGILAGTINLDIPPDTTTVHTGYCTMSSDVTLFAVAPHMHQLGIHEKVVAEPAAGDATVLLDADYDFNEQSYRLIEPVKLAKGDRVRVECTHRNTTSKRVTFGESTLSEMCFAGIYRYPADGKFFVCADPAGTGP